MYNWNQFRNFPKFKEMSAQEQSRQYFLYQSNMMMEQSSNSSLAPAAAAAAAAGAGAGGGGSLPTVEVIPTFAFKSNNNQLDINFGQGASLEGTLVINWGDGVTETFINQGFSTLSHTYDKQNADLVKINITTDLDITSINMSSNQLTEIATGELPSSLTDLYLSSNSLTSFDPSIALPSSLENLNLNNNSLTSFDPSIALPNSLRYLYLNSNSLSFNPSLPLPSSLENLNLNNNGMTSFNPTNALPNSLRYLYLNNNGMTSFNPSIALPSSLQRLALDNNGMTSFNPSIALPNSLRYLPLSNNQLTSFNPSQPLPSSLLELELHTNQLNTAAVNTTLILLNTRYTVSGSKYFGLQMSPSAPPSGAGLTAKTSLQSRGFTVQTN